LRLLTLARRWLLRLGPHALRRLVLRCRSLWLGRRWLWLLRSLGLARRLCGYPLGELRRLSFGASLLSSPRI